jgi:hypothetical protein
MKPKLNATLLGTLQFWRKSIINFAEYLLDNYEFETGISLFACTDTVHAGPTGKTYALSCQFPVFHCDNLAIFNFSLGTAPYTITFHFFLPTCDCF